MQGLNRRWINGYKPAANVGAEVARKIVASLERLEVLKNDDAIPDSDPVALERKVRRNRLLPLAQEPEGTKAPKKVTRSTELRHPPNWRDHLNVEIKTKLRKKFPVGSDFVADWEVSIPDYLLDLLRSKHINCAGARCVSLPSLAHL